MEPILLRADRAGERADQLLARLVPELTRSAAQRLLEAGAVTLGGRPVKKNDKAAAGDVLEVRLPEPEPVDVLPQAIPLDVAYEDADVIVVNKPVGLVVHPAAGHPDGTLCYITVANHSLESTEPSAPASSTASTGTHRGCSLPPRTTMPTRPWPPSSRITPFTGSTRRCAWAACARTAAPWTRPSAATPPTGRRCAWIGKTAARL